ncbi:MAG: sensor histidine kinase [Burkholderiales bacterium]|nr:sensor histidine kinase [Burkholderiales bacterium]
MHDADASVSPRRRLPRWQRWLLVLGAVASCALVRAADPTTTQPPVRLDKALMAVSASPVFPVGVPTTSVTLPDDWAATNPRHDGIVWYRVAFRFAEATLPDDLLALYVEQACTNLQVLLNGHLIYSGGRMVEPTTRNCARPHLITLPPALLNANGNALDLRVLGHPVESVGSVRRAGGLSALELGMQSTLSVAHSGRTFWEPAWIRGTSLVLVGLGCLMLAIGWLHKREVYFSYFGWLCLGWAIVSTAIWARDLPWNNGVSEFMLSSAWPILLAFAVQFLLSFAGLRSRMIENVLALQWVALPLSLVVAGPDHRFVVANVWYALLAAEVAIIVGLYLVTARRQRPQDFGPLLIASVIGAAALALELGVQWSEGDPDPVSIAECVVPGLLIYLGGRLFLMFARALRETVADRNRLAEQMHRMSTEMEARVDQLTVQKVEELTARRVEQFTQQERRRIASDLHDDLGAKLLTIVHTSDSARIPQLAREALDEMRLSVRGLAGKPVRLDEALADWRAEVMTRLQQAAVEARWANPQEALEQTLSARVFMQVTRILREAISNVIKHSSATVCEVRCRVVGKTLEVRVRDDGRGITADLQRGQGMTTMKRRAKQIEGQCLVESRAGFGVVISLTVPL